MHSVTELQRRLHTFDDWPPMRAPAPKKELLARYGFVAGERDEERDEAYSECETCGLRVSVSAWKDSAVLETHRRLRPECAFVKSTFELLRYSDDARLDTFDDWPYTRTGITPFHMSECALFYTHRDDEVMCCFCNNCMRYWKYGMEPFHVHTISTIMNTPPCPFVGNREMCLHLLYDTCGMEDDMIPPTVSSSSSWTPRPRQVVAPLRPDLKYREQRVATFPAATTQFAVDVGKLATAGFFYVGDGDDKTCCFHCGLGVYRWNADDDPWTEHARWKPNCQFVLLRKGADFIEDCEDLQYRCYSAMARYLTDEPPNQEESAQLSELRKLTVRSVVECDHGRSVGNVRYQYSDCVIHDDDAVVKWMRSIPRGVPRNTIDAVLLRYLRNRNEGNSETALAVFSDAFIAVERNVETEMEQRLRWKARRIDRWLHSQEFHNRQASRQPVQLKSAEEKKLKMPEQEEKKDEENVEASKREEALDCKVCFERQLNIVFLPCGHLITCDQCAIKLTQCAMCRRRIDDTVRVFI